MNEDGMLTAHPLSIFALDPAVITEIAAAIGLGVGVDDLTIKSRLRHTQTVIVMHHRRGVYHERDHVAFPRFSQERHYAVVSIVEIDPVKSFIFVVLVP